MKISSKDLILLSAYLDGELSAGQKDRLEERLLSERVLADELDKLSRTRKVLRSAPRLSAPRNFTLTPDMVDARKRVSWPKLLRGLRLASAAAAVLLVGLLVYDYSGILAPAVLQGAAPPEVMQEAVTSAENRLEGTTSASPVVEDEMEALGEIEAPAEMPEEEQAGEADQATSADIEDGEQAEEPSVKITREEEHQDFSGEEDIQTETADQEGSAPDWLLILEISLALSAAGLGVGAYAVRKKMQ
jgi:anti-sigma factor RsiW